MFNLSNTETLTARRKAYVQRLMSSAAETVANDLHNGDTTRDVAVTALGQLWAAYKPSTGKGHADQCRDEVEQAVDAFMESGDEQDAA